MELVFLGTGGSYPSRNRNVAGIAFKGLDHTILFDCGEGTQRQLMQSPVSFMKIDHIFITHFHGDHFLGLAGLLQTMALNNRSEPITVYGPDSMEEIGAVILNMGRWKPSYELSFVTMKPGSSMNIGNYTISAELADHTITDLAYMIREKDRRGSFDRSLAKKYDISGKDFSILEEKGSLIKNKMKIAIEDVTGPVKKGRSIVYTGDSRPSKRIEEFAEGVDILVHDSTVMSDLEEKANEYGHSSARQAANVALDCRAGKLLLTHISPRYEEISGLLLEARNIFPESYVPDDFSVWKIA